MDRYIRLGDLRFGAAPDVGHDAPPALRAELRRDPEQVLERVAALAAEHAVDAVVVAGELLSEQDCTHDDLARLHALIARVPAPVLAVARDAWPGSALSPERELLGLERRAANLQVVAELPPPPSTDVVGPLATLVDAAAGTVTPLEVAPRRRWTVDLDVTPVLALAELEALARQALERAGSGAMDLAWLRLGGEWRVPSLPRVRPEALAGRCAHAWVVAGDLVLAPPAGASVFELHLRSLIARMRGAGDRAAGLREVELALDAWRGALP